MNEYTNFFGIDIAKDDFVAALYGQKTVKTYTNNASGFADFAKNYRETLQESFVVLESTGGYEWDLMMFLKKQHLPFHRADTLKVKRFIRSIRHFGKTDAIDAQGLAMYACERHRSLKLFQEKEERQLLLQLLVRRRDELVQMRIQELNRAQSPLSKLLPLPDSFSNILEALNEEIEAIDAAIKFYIESDQNYNDKKLLMVQMAGIGEITASKLLALTPELGFLTRRAIASMAGLAPHPYDSGKMTGYRKTRGGRPDVKNFIYSRDVCF